MTTIDRRALLVGTMSLAGMGAAGDAHSRTATPGASATTPALPLFARAAREAYLYTLPLIESAAARAGLLAIEPGRRPHRLYFQPAPTTPATQRVTTPNNDTLNGRGWFDLAQGPVRLRWGSSDERYLSIALMDMWSNNVVVLGSRTTGPDGGDVTIVGPDAAPPPGAVRSPTRWAWIMVRIVVAGRDDLAAAKALQNTIRVDAAPFVGTISPCARRDAPWREYFRSAARLMRENHGPATDAALLRRIAPLGLDRFDPGRFAPAQAREIAAGVADARRSLRAQTARGPTIDGWMYPRTTLGDFRQDYVYRAQTALNGFAALPNDEAIYLFAAGPRGDLMLDSATPWRLLLQSDALPPTEAFWSLVAYRATPDGQFFLFDNPLGRYSVGDRTSGLRRRVDGSIEIALQRGPPPPDAAVNWLPTPQDAPFGAVFRVYRPGQAVIDGDWRLPALRQAH